MTDDEIVDAYIKLFRGRGDAIGTWEGGSIRTELDRSDFANHLKSTYQDEWIGVYPHLGDRGVSWGCIDIDGKDFQKEDHTDADVLGVNWVHDWARMLTLAHNIQAVLDYKHVYAHIEQTRNGYHLWVFPEAGIVPAAYMRRALMAACKACRYDPKEVNPKQETLNPDKPFGNYVRLPYYGALANGTPIDRFVIDEDGPMTVEEFTRTATTHRTSVGTCCRDLGRRNCSHTPVVARHRIHVRRAGQASHRQ